MFGVRQDDVDAIQRAFALGGQTQAMSELRRRGLVVDESTAAVVLDRILALRGPTPANFSGRPGPDAGGSDGRGKKRSY